MGLFDIFTGDPYKEAAAKQQAYLTGVSNNIQSGIGQAQGQGLSALTSGQNQGINALQTGQATARGDIQNYSPQALAALYGGQTGGTSALLSGQAGGLGALQSGVGQATAAFAPVAGMANQYGAFGNDASQAQRDALGLNGPEGIARAQQAFQTTPGYTFARDQAVDSAVRGANAAGMGASGNTLAGITSLVGNQIAPGQWNQYTTGLQNQQNLYSPLALSGAGTAATGTANAALTGGTGAANIYTGTAGKLSDLLSGTGTNAANILQGTGTNLANLASRGGEDQSGVYTGTGTNIANLLAQLSGQSIQGQTGLAGPMTQSYGLGAAGQMAGSQNLWNLIGSGVTAGAKLLG